MGKETCVCGGIGKGAEGMLCDTVRAHVCVCVCVCVCWWTGGDQFSCGADSALVHIMSLHECV